MAEQSREGAPVVVLGVCGGIAAYKAVELCRLLSDAGCYVAPVLTEAATRFIAPLTFSALASEPAQLSLYGEQHPSPHTRLGQMADLVVVAPATQNFLARLANGQVDDLLTATVAATRAQVVVAPAMHTEMWEQASTQAAIEVLKSRGVLVVEPDSGRLAGGDMGFGRLADPAAIATAVLSQLNLRNGGTRDLEGRSVLITAGGTREAIDPVRYLSNRSSGKQGYALADAAAARGAKVTLITAARLPLSPLTKAATTVVDVESAAEMADAVLRAAPSADVVVMAAAIADYRPVQIAGTKLTKDLGIPTLVLEETQDVLAAVVAKRPAGQIIVGFAAETHDVLNRGKAKLKRKGCDLLVVNDVSQPEVGFDHETNAVTILGSDGLTTTVDLSSKAIVAHSVFDRVTRLQSTSMSERTSSD
ncbi:MAG: bifunctional phosphopantothenoylcysteine decarboxylase/phosphopantothenate--cysteine ligase CoaBC [Actinomycetota bacterium]